MPGLFTASVKEPASMFAMRNLGHLGFAAIWESVFPRNTGGRCCCRNTLVLHANLSTSLAVQPQVKGWGQNKFPRSGVTCLIPSIKVLPQRPYHRMQSQQLVAGDFPWQFSICMRAFGSRPHFKDKYDFNLFGLIQNIFRCLEAVQTPSRFSHACTCSIFQAIYFLPEGVWK